MKPDLTGFYREKEDEASAASRTGYQVRVDPQTGARRVNKTGRNAPCPCGSGKKYKHCHLDAPLKSEVARASTSREVLGEIVEDVIPKSKTL